jgi:hypothetical protein
MDTPKRFVLATAVIVSAVLTALPLHEASAQADPAAIARPWTQVCTKAGPGAASSAVNGGTYWQLSCFVPDGHLQDPFPKSEPLAGLCTAMGADLAFDLAHDMVFCIVFVP